MAQVTIRQALQNVADYPQPISDEWVNMPVSELVARALFDIANRPDASVRGSMARANKARKMIMDRLVGRRRAGTQPLRPGKTEISFVDLTGGELGGTAQPDAAEADRPAGDPDQVDG